MSVLLHEENREEESDFEEHGHQRRLVGWAASLVVLGALAFSAYQISVAAFHPFSSLVIRALHVSFLMFLIFMLYPMNAKGRSEQSIPWYDVLLALLGFGVGFYHLIFEADLIERSGDPTHADLIVATLASVLVFEAARRVVGWALTLVCAAFLAYRLFRAILTAFDRASRFRVRSDRRAALFGKRRHFRDADLGLRDVHLFVYLIRNVFGTCGDDSPF